MLSGGRAAYVGPGLDLAPHRNLAATVAIALDARFELRMLRDGRDFTGDDYESAHIALIPPGAFHHLRTAGDMAFLYLDAMSDDVAQLSAADLASAHAGLLHKLRDRSQSPGVDELCLSLGVPRRSATDDRIAAVARLIDRQPQAIATLAEAAAMAGLSSSRFQSLFRQAVGMPFRRYRLWRRMAVVLKAATSGATLTTAAIDAGFASSAHLSATFKAMFGLPPSSLLALGIQVDSDE